MATITTLGLAHPTPDAVEHFEIGKNPLEGMAIAGAGVALVTSMACSSPLQKTMSYIEYTQDARTGLCFAVLNPSASGQSISEVPCTPKVMQAIDADKKK